MRVRRENPLGVACPTCNSIVGQKCRDYKGRNMAPHRDRVWECLAPVILPGPSMTQGDLPGLGVS